jgi:hypothetical protein
MCEAIFSAGYVVLSVTIYSLLPTICEILTLAIPITIRASCFGVSLHATIGKNRIQLISDDFRYDFNQDPEKKMRLHDHRSPERDTYLFGSWCKFRDISLRDGL